MMAKVMAFVGKVNSNNSWFVTDDVTKWLFSGLNSTEQYDSAAGMRWKAEMTFTYCAIPLQGGPPTTYGGWNYVWSKVDDKYVVPKTPAGWPAGETYPYISGHFGTAAGQLFGS